MSGDAIPLRATSSDAQVPVGGIWNDLVSSVGRSDAVLVRVPIDVDIGSPQSIFGVRGISVAADGPLAAVRLLIGGKPLVALTSGDWRHWLAVFTEFPCLPLGWVTHQEIVLEARAPPGCRIPSFDYRINWTDVVPSKHDAYLGDATFTQTITDEVSGKKGQFVIANGMADVIGLDAPWHPPNSGRLACLWSDARDGNDAEVNLVRDEERVFLTDYLLSASACC